MPHILEGGGGSNVDNYKSVRLAPLVHKTRTILRGSIIKKLCENEK